MYIGHRVASVLPVTQGLESCEQSRQAMDICCNCMNAGVSPRTVSTTRVTGQHGREAKQNVHDRGVRSIALNVHLLAAVISET